jgi:protein-disulfide isomerase
MIKSLTGRLTAPVEERDHALGSASALVTLVEYGDYECPYCGRAHQVVKQLLLQLGHQVRFVYRHFPLASAHPHAQQAAEAAEAAGVQRAFWEMHDMLFENQDALDDADLMQYAAAIDLDVSQFYAQLVTHVHAHRVREDVLTGAHSGVNGTPTFFINGMRHDGSFDFDMMLNAIAFAMDRV